MIPHSPVPPSGKELPPPADVKKVVSQMAAAPNDRASATTGTAERAKKFNVAHYRHKYLLLRVNQFSRSEIPLRDMSHVHVFFLLQSFHAYGFDQARYTVSVKTVATASRSKACEGAPSSTPRVLDDTASMVPLDKWNLLQALRDPQMAEAVTWVEAPLLVRCVTRHDGRPAAKTEALKLSNLAN